MNDECIGKEELSLDDRIKVYTTKDVLNIMQYKNNEEVETTEDIIHSVLMDISNGIENNNVVSIPLLGCIRKSPVRQAVLANKKALKLARKNMTKTEFKEYSKYIINKDVNKLHDNDRIKSIYKKLISRNRKKYERLYQTLGKTYANTYIYCLYLCDYVPYSQEVEDAFNRVE